MRDSDSILIGRRHRTALLGAIFLVACSGNGTTDGGAHDAGVTDTGASTDAPGDAVSPLDVTPSSDVAPLDAPEPDASDLDAPALDAPASDDIGPLTDVAGDGAILDAGAIPSNVFHRIALGRMYLQRPSTPTGLWTLPGETADNVGNAMARFAPTYVSGLLRITDPSLVPSAAMIAGYNTVRDRVRAAVPQAAFDVVLSSVSYNTPEQLIGHMRAIASRIPVNIWFFDFFNCGAPLGTAPDAPSVDRCGGGYPQGVETQYVLYQAIQWAHAHGQYVGGNFFGDPTSTRGTSHADFFVLTDDDTLQPDYARIMTFDGAFAVPILYHTNNNPQNESSPDCSLPGADAGACMTASCKFMRIFDYGRRLNYLDDRASNQTSMPGQPAHHYKFMYDLFFPACPLESYYDSRLDVGGPRNDSMLVEMARLADMYNP